MSKKENDIALFVAFCIEEYGAAHGMTGDKVFDLFARYGVVDYLSEFYDTLHTQSRQWLLEDISEFIEIRKKERQRACATETTLTVGTMTEVNQSNLHLLVPGKTRWMAEYMRDDYGLSLQESLDRIYHSLLYKKLTTESTKYWHLGPVDLYNELKAELK